MAVYGFCIEAPYLNFSKKTFTVIQFSTDVIGICEILELYSLADVLNCPSLTK